LFGIMKVRRKILAAVALAIALADGGYIIRLSFESDEDLKAEWVAYMPVLEEKQRLNPSMFLYSSHSSNPEAPELYGIDSDGAYSLFTKFANDCKIQEYVITEYIPRNSKNAPRAMPDRFYTGKLNPAKAACLRTLLPKGYVLARLEHQVNPRQVGWGRQDLHLAKAQ
jgi:hypothetical protein